jgi:predicted ribosome quality control (RQC) complex YloA/Tae2 family protein
MDCEIVIGKNKYDNNKIISENSQNDFWFHIQKMPSAHLILKCNCKKKNKCIKESAHKLKSSSKYKNLKNLKIVYTQLKNVKKTKEIGKVIIKNKSIISI